MYEWLKKRMVEKDGFTLVELIVVIVIILVLSAVMIPNIIRFTGKANRTTVIADASTLLKQVQAEVTDAIATGADPTKIQMVNNVSFRNMNGAGTKKGYGNYSNKYSNFEDGKTARYRLNESMTEIEEFGYCDKDKGYFINWTKDDGWDEIRWIEKK